MFIRVYPRPIESFVLKSSLNIKSAFMYVPMKILLRLSRVSSLRLNDVLNEKEDPCPPT